MTALSTYRSKDIQTILKGLTQYSVGLDDWIDRLEAYGCGATNYPPYNILKESNSKWVIEIALAGWEKDDIEVLTESNVLMISSKSQRDDSRVGTYYHRGLASRNFTKTFNLSDDVEVGEVTFKNGLLTIELNKVIPEHQKRKVYEII